MDLVRRHIRAPAGTLPPVVVHIVSRRPQVVVVHRQPPYGLCQVGVEAVELLALLGVPAHLDGRGRAAAVRRGAAETFPGPGSGPGCGPGL